MEYALIRLPATRLIGLAVRTTNEHGRSEKDLRLLWQRFYEESIPEKIAGKISNDLYCAYTDYESDHRGAYTALLGYEVNSEAPVPKGCAAVLIPAGTYRRYRSMGKIPESVLATWMEIWQSSIDRSYVIDFDRYGANAQNPESAEVETYLSVKSSTPKED